MVVFTNAELKDLLKSFSGKRIAVVGDLMLDRYFWGSVGRISPEAPVPIVEVSEESTRLGGAANVVSNIASLGGIPVPVGVAGADANGHLLLQAIGALGFSTDGIIEDSSRPTTVKTRVIADGQHVVRVDQEVKQDIGPAIAGKVLDFLSSNLAGIDGIILQDYNKGVLTASLITDIIALARKHGKILTVDPKFNNFFSYKDATVFKPNRKETEEALGIRMQSEDDIRGAGKRLLAELKAEHVLLTLGEKGMALFESSGDVSLVPTKARHVADVSGAGDTVIATLTVALAAGANVRQASILANFAGGIVCGEVGIVPIEQKVLLQEVMSSEHVKGGS